MNRKQFFRFCDIDHEACMETAREKNKDRAWDTDALENIKDSATANKLDVVLWVAMLLVQRTQRVKGIVDKGESPHTLEDSKDNIVYSHIHRALVFEKFYGDKLDTMSDDVFDHTVRAFLREK